MNNSPNHNTAAGRSSRGHDPAGGLGDRAGLGGRNSQLATNGSGSHVIPPRSPGPGRVLSKVAVGTPGGSGDRRRASEAAEATRRAQLALGTRLRHLRQDAHLSGRALAERAGWSPSKVSRIEHGAQPPSVADIRAWCEYAEVPERADELVATLRVIDSLYTEWHRLDGPGLTALQQTVVPLWERTRTFRFYSPFLIPTPVQTPDYARALLLGIRDRRGTADDFDDAVAARMQRQQALHEPHRRFVILLEEAALTYLTGDAATTIGQLGHLLAVATLPTLSLGIIPSSLDRSSTWPVESFYVYDDHEVHIELVSGSVQFTQPHEVATYTTMFTDLSALAVRGQHARTLINKAIGVLDS